MAFRARRSESEFSIILGDALQQSAADWFTFNCLVALTWPSPLLVHEHTDEHTDALIIFSRVSALETAYASPNCGLCPGEPFSFKSGFSQ